MKNAFFYILMLTFLFKIAAGQPLFPDNGELYIDNTVPRIDIIVDPDTLEWLYEYENLTSDIEYHAMFVFDNGNVRDTVYPVGFRLRGNTSRYSAKKSFKVSFNTFTSGGKYYGVEKLNLNGEHNDPSVIRSKICWDLLRQWEIPAPRSNHVEVYINGDYYGLYISVEHIDEEFILKRFRYNDGNLYKCLWPADLNYLGDDPDLYKFEHEGRRAYELKINEEADDYSDLAHFIDVLNNTPEEDLYCELERVFNVSDYIKVIAMDVLTGNWDGYIYNQNNFYLYHNTVSGKFEYIPYDLDNTLGIDWLGRDWGSRDIYDWQQHGDNHRPLYVRLMNTQEFRSQYTYYTKLLNTSLDVDSLENAVLQRRDMIFPSLASDEYYSMDYGYSPQDFLDSYQQALGGHVAYGLFPFLDTRISHTVSQLETTMMIPVIKYIRHKRLTATSLLVNARIDVQENPASSEVNYAFEGGETLTISMFDDGQHEDGDAGDGIYGATIEEIPDQTALTYQVKVSDAMNQTATLPCEPVYVYGVGGELPSLYINEFMASNETIITDENGEYDDWIEIYNAGEEAVWLGDKFLTDNMEKPDKWAMPEINIEPGEFLLFWADDQAEQGPYHTNFKLSKDGEDIAIFSITQEAIDQYVFGEQETDISEGRFPDGADNWIMFESPTPRVSNELTDIVEVDNIQPVLYPNPSAGGQVHLSEKADFRVYDMMGSLVGEYRNTRFFNTSTYNKGMYIVVMNNGQRIKWIRK